MKNRERVIIGITLGFSLIFLAWDILSDMYSGSTWIHVSQELIAFTLLLIGLAALLWRYVGLKSEVRTFQKKIEDVRNDLENYKKETAHLVKGINEKVKSQMEKWKLSEAEKDVCFLLLKGLSGKEIAHIRNSSEKTISLQLSSVYQKSGLQGRSELFAFFLEDIFITD